MSKAPPSWIISCAMEKKNTLENITGIIDGIIDYIPSVCTPEESPNTPVNCDQVSVTSINSLPVYSPLSSTLTMSPGKTNSPLYSVFCDLIPTKDISWVKIVRDYLTTIEESLDRKIKTMNDIYLSLRNESGVCHSQYCSFKRHGNDMGFMVHTLCTNSSCVNFNECINNVEALESIVKDNLIVMEDPVIGQNEKGLFSGNSGFEVGGFFMYLWWPC